MAELTAAPIEIAWTLIGTAPDAWSSPADVDLGSSGWISAIVPGTVAQALVAATGTAGEADVEGSDWWFRGIVGRLDAATGGANRSWRLTFDGIATIAEIHLPDGRVVASEGMWRRHELVLNELHAGDVVFVVCRALRPRLRMRRRPMARWRTALIPDGELRWWRTSLLGRIPAWSPAPPAVGPHGDVTLEALGPDVLGRTTLRWDSTTDRLEVEVCAAAGGGAAADGAAGQQARIVVGLGDRRTVLEATDPPGPARWTGALDTAGLARWWPHTHGEPVLHDVELLVGEPGRERVVDRRRVGLRTIEADRSDGGFGLVVNGQPVFARGACWVPLDPVSFRNDTATVRAAVAQLASAGANILRVTGTATYEDDAFHHACDELGVMVWQDLMFSNLDIPIDDVAVAAEIEAELAAVLPRLAAHASTAVVCGGSEVEQQAAMMGADPSCWREGLFVDVLPVLVATHAPGVAYVSNSPSGGAVPFRTSEGVAHYFGVGGYRRPLADVRAAGVRFASECLAFANVPEPEPTDHLLAAGPVGSGPWKQRVVRDRTASWDFEDVRDTYVAELFGVDPVAVRASDPMRYLDLGRMASGEAMAQVFGWWRAAQAGCRGGIVLQARDWWPGSGWGIADSDGNPKSVHWYLRRAWTSRGVLVSDDGLDGLSAHVVNERPDPFVGSLRVRRWLGDAAIETGSVAVSVGPGTVTAVHLDEVIGGFRDLGWAYRFGPPGHDAVVVELLDATGTIVQRAIHLLPHARQSTGAAGGVALDMSGAIALGEGAVTLVASVIGGPAVVAVEAAGWAAIDNYVTVLPGLPEPLVLRPVADAPGPSGRVRVVAGRAEARVALRETT